MRSGVIAVFRLGTGRLAAASTDPPSLQRIELMAGWQLVTMEQRH
jgi:hypothetical protein